MSTIYIQRKSAVKNENISGAITDTTNVTNKKTNTYSARVIDMLINIATPVGSGMDYYGTEAPLNYMFADGRELSRTEYAELFKIIGTTYGAGDGSTTFNLPDKRTRVTVMKDNGTFNTLGKTGGAETHQHKYGFQYATFYDMISLEGNTQTGLLNYSDSTNFILTGGDNKVNNLITNYNSGVGESRTTKGADYHRLIANTSTSSTLQPYLVCNYIIKVSSENQSIDDLLTEALERSY